MRYLRRLSKLINEAEDEAKKDEPFQGLDLRYARCFGCNSPIVDCWTYLGNQAEELGWNAIDQHQLENSLISDVDKSYSNIAEFVLVDVEDDMSYSLNFNNKLNLWQLEITNSPKAELTTEERANFFKSSMFKKIANQTYRWLNKAKDVYMNVIDKRMKDGDLLNVDVIKLRAILDMISSKHFLDNLKSGKYFND